MKKTDHERKKILEDFITDVRFVPEGHGYVGGGYWQFNTMYDIADRHRGTHCVPITDVDLDSVLWHQRRYESIGTYAGNTLYCREDAE